jgi:phosphoenolpyruvate carboxykinase (ATP)
LTIVDLPSFRADTKRHGARAETIIACDFTRKIVLIGGTSYAGEMKKAVFTFLNYALPRQNIMPMHCSANSGRDGDAAIFFGLSGTGKTTLSADPHRVLIGDDEHGWGKNGVFNFEGGCYAKAIRLSRDAEPEICSTTERFGTVMENVALDRESRQPDFDDDSKTENTRIAYPLHFVENASSTGRAGPPRNVIVLTCDAFGVLPPIAKLDPAQAMYHFLSGYTAKVAGTEKGVTEPSATFSTCFGAPFMPLHPTVYGNLLRNLVERHHVIVGSSIRVGRPAGWGLVDECRSASHAAYSPRCSTAHFTKRISAPIRISASPFPRKYGASSRISSIPSRLGAIKMNSPRQPAA